MTANGMKRPACMSAWRRTQLGSKYSLPQEEESVQPGRRVQVTGGAEVVPVKLAHWFQPEDAVLVRNDKVDNRVTTIEMAGFRGAGGSDSFLWRA